MADTQPSQTDLSCNDMSVGGASFKETSDPTKKFEPPPPPPPPPTPAHNVQMANSPDDGGENDDRALVHALLALNVTSLFAITQVWVGYRSSLPIDDRILIYVIAFCAVAASFFCIFTHRLLRKPAAAERKWVVLRVAITFTGWDLIGWLCFFLPGVSKVPVMIVASLLCSLSIFTLW